MSANVSLGWIGMGRMGYPMAELLLKAGYRVSIYNRTRAKAEPLAAKGGTIVDRPSELAGCDIVFAMVSTGKDLGTRLFRRRRPVDRLGQEAANSRRLFIDRHRPVEAIPSGSMQRAANSYRRRSAATASASRPASSRPSFPARKAAFEEVKPISPRSQKSGVSYVGEGELARICKIAHNVFLGVVIENPRRDHHSRAEGRRAASRLPRLHERQRAGPVSRNTRATPSSISTGRRPRRRCCARIDLGLKAARDLDVPMPVTSAAREALQAHFGAASLHPIPPPISKRILWR